MEEDNAVTIREATLKEVYDFFDKTTKTLYGNIMHALFDPQRLLKCDVVFVAECGGRIVGAVTLAFNGLNGATLDSVYVLPDQRGRGAGYRLCETGLRRFQAEGKTPVYCEVNSRALHAAIKRLPADLRAPLRLNLTYQVYGELELPEELNDSRVSS